MKVMLDDGRLTEIGKTLPLEAVDAEAIGLYVFRGKGAGLYREVLERAMREPSGLKQWFPAAVGQLAKLTGIKVSDVSGHEWSEVDFPVDLQSARAMAANWDQPIRKPRLAVT
jgi:choline kinase